MKSGIVESLIGWKGLTKPMSLIVTSVGNPGQMYQGTRHNAGHMLLQGMRDRLEIGNYLVKPVQGGVLTAFEQYPGLLFMQSHHLMNLSNRALLGIYKFCDKHRKQEFFDRRVIVLHDELDLKLGEVAYKEPSRATNGHKGLKNIVERTEPKFARFKVGISRPESKVKMIVSNYVLGKFTPEELAVFNNVTLPKGLEMLQEIINSGVLARPSDIPPNQNYPFVAPKAAEKSGAWKSVQEEKSVNQTAQAEADDQPEEKEKLL